MLVLNYKSLSKIKMLKKQKSSSEYARMLQTNSGTLAMKSALRLIKYKYLYSKARVQGLVPRNIIRTRSFPITFIVGCGRSGTTILGKILAEHSEVNYLFEPYHLWTAMDRRTDVANLFGRSDGKLIMDQRLVTDSIQKKFSRLFIPSSGCMLIEKTPLNVFRIGYLKALAPHAKFIHLVRDGVDVSYSIGHLATVNSYKIAGKPQFNQWWGVGRNRWHTLQSEGKAMGYWPDEVDLLRTEEQFGAYEWLASLSEMNRWRSELDSSVHEIAYNELVSEPRNALIQLCDFLNIGSPEDWLSLATHSIQQRSNNNRTISLPPQMAFSFNNYQQQYKFPQRALET